MSVGESAMSSRGADHALVGATFNMLNTLAAGGIGFVSLPFMVRKTGLAWFIGLFTLTAAWMAYTCWMLVAVSGLTGSTTYEGNAERTLGRTARLVPRILVATFTFGVCITLLDVVGDVAPGIVGLHRTVCVALAGLVVAPIVIYVRRIEALAPLSGVSAALCVVFVGFLVVRMVIGPRSADVGASLKMQPTASAMLGAVSVTIFGLLGQVNALPILSRIPGSAEEARGTMTSAIVAAFALSWAIYLAAAVLAFLTLGEQTTGDVLSDYSSTAVGQAIRGAVTLGMLLSLPLFSFEGVNMLISLGTASLDDTGTAPDRPDSRLPAAPPAEANSTDSAELQTLLSSPPSGTRSTLLAPACGFAWVVASTAAAMAVGHTSSVMAVLGAFCGTPIALVLPPLMLLKAQGAASTASSTGTIFNWLLVGVGCAMTVVCCVASLLAFASSPASVFASSSSSSSASSSA